MSASRNWPMLNQQQNPSALPRILAFGLLSTLSTIAIASDTSDATAVAEVIQFEKQIERTVNSPEFAQDPSIALAFYERSDKMRFFDIMQPIELRGEAFRSHLTDVAKQFEGGKVEFLELEVVAEKDMAFATSLQHLLGKSKDGKRFDMTMRVTDCLRKVSGRWLIVHEHVSLPLDAATFSTVIAAKQ